MKREFVTSNSRGPTQADLNALKAKVDSLLATNGRRPAGPPPTQAQINHEIKRQMAGLIVDLQEAGFDTREVEANIQQLTTNASDTSGKAGDYIADELLSRELPGDEPQGQPATNSGERFEYLAPELLSTKLPE